VFFFRQRCGLFNQRKRPMKLVSCRGFQRSITCAILTLIALPGWSVRAADVDAAALREFAREPLVFDPFCFTGDQFPKCDFQNPARVEKLIGRYTLKTTWYNAEGKAVTAPAPGPGRYAAVVEIARSGRTSKRFFTLFHLGGKQRAVRAMGARLEFPHGGTGIEQDLIDQQRNDVDDTVTRAMATAMSQQPEVASLLAGLHDLNQLGRQGKAAPDDHASDRDRQWWVDFKRKYYGYDKRYPERFVCPRPMKEKSAPEVRKGTLAEAGMKADARDTIDAACATWLKENGTGFSICVVRRGVIVLHQGYGKTEYKGVTSLEAAKFLNVSPNQKPVTADTPGVMASTTKFLNAILLLEMIDQGLMRMEDPIDQHIVAFKGVAAKRPVTVRDLYLHTAGFTTQDGDLFPDLEERIADMYPALEGGAPHRYQGTGLALASKIMEMKTGEALPYLYQNHLFKPLGCTQSRAEFSAYGTSSVTLDLARIGQMLLNGGAYGDKRFFRPETLAQMMPVPGKDRIGDDKSVRWGVGIKQFDIDGLSEKAFGHGGGSGSFLVIDPEHELVIAQTRLKEGARFEDFLKQRGKVVGAAIAAIERK
jgi:CubicO group peptidase (beta-lactamase class C family)